MSASELVLMAPIPRPALRPVQYATLARALLVALGVHAALLALLVLFIRPARLPETAGPPAFTMVFAPDTPLEPAQAAPNPAPPPPVSPAEAEAAAPPAPEPPLTPAAPAPALETAAPPAAAAPLPPPVLPTAPPPSLPIPPKPPMQVRPPHPAAPPRALERSPSHRMPRVAIPAPRAPDTPTARDERPGPAAIPPRAPTEMQAPASSPAPATPISGGWRNALIGWLQAHKTYPEAARLDGTEGRVVLRFTASRDGRVLQVTVIQPSGSRVLDEAAEALLRGARLPSFPASMTQDTATVTLPLTYQLE